LCETETWTAGMGFSLSLDAAGVAARAVALLTFPGVPVADRMPRKPEIVECLEQL
jgi:hypothetical protein